MAAKSKKITIRLSLENYLAVRDEAYSKGQDMGPLIDSWIQPRLKAAKARQAASNPDE